MHKCEYCGASNTRARLCTACEVTERLEAAHAEEIAHLTGQRDSLLDACQQALDYIDQANAAGLLEACKGLYSNFAFHALGADQVNAANRARTAIDTAHPDQAESQVTAMLATAIRGALTGEATDGQQQPQRPDVASLARAYFAARDVWIAAPALAPFEALSMLKRRRDEAEAALRAAVDGQG